jgi:hypothetical protein
MNARSLAYVSLLWLAACKQPAPKCNVSHGPFWAKYTLVSGEGDCAMLTGEELDVQSYYAPRSTRDPRPDYGNVSMAIAPASVTAALANAAGLAEPAMADTPYALGQFSASTPDAEGFCRVPQLAAARLRLAEVPEHALDMCTTAAAAPAYDVSYEFSNVRVYYTPAAIGTQFAAELRYRQRDCVATYRVSALYPMISCAAPSADAGAPGSADADEDASGGDEDASLDAGCPLPPAAAGPSVADDALCQGAGINPDFAVACDPVAQMCVLTSEPPSLH